MGGAAGEAYANTLKSPGMQPEHVLAREAIQNSVDAAVGGKVRVCFRQRQLTGAAKRTFATAADLAGIAERVNVLQVSPDNCLAALEKSRTPLSVLYVEDHGAEGLSGDPHDKGSNFYRLLLSLGDRTKARSARGSGGSYGFGKSVYSASSALQTIFAYTRFRDGKRGERTRIFGCGYYASHEHRRRSYSGRAWLGRKPRRDDAGRTVVDPLEGREADALASQLGFEIRESGDLGTTILIVDSTPDLARIVEGVEDWWWPRLVAHELDVEVIDAKGEITVPRPRKNPALRPFIDAYEIATGVAVAKSGSQKSSPLNRLGETMLGTCGFVVAPLNDQGVPVIRSDRCNAVALIRAPRMVVAYKSMSESAPAVVGAFVAADEIDGILKLSEPPAHDRWDEDSGNLRDPDGHDKDVVRAVLSRIRSGLKRFQGEAAPASLPRQKRLSLLERALGTYFRPRGEGRPSPPAAGPSLVHLTFTHQPTAEATVDGRIRLRSAFAVALDPAADEGPVPLRVRIACPVLEDDGQEGADLAVAVRVRGVTAAPDPSDPNVRRIALSKGEKARFDVESEAYDPAWTVRFRPEIEAEVSA